MNEIHIYRMRHIFKGDDLVAKYDSQTRSIRVFEAFAALKDDLRAWMIRTHSIFATALVGEEQIAAAAPPLEFPDDIRALMTPQLGDLTPAAVEYARKNFPREEFEKRYQGRVKFEAAESPKASVSEETAEPKPASKTPKKQAKKQAANPPPASEDDDDDAEELPES